jgi:hypothetical protein
MVSMKMGVVPSTWYIKCNMIEKRKRGQLMTLFHEKHRKPSQVWKLLFDHCLESIVMAYYKGDVVESIVMAYYKGDVAKGLTMQWQRPLVRVLPPKVQTLGDTLCTLIRGFPSGIL